MGRRQPKAFCKAMEHKKALKKEQQRSGSKTLKKELHKERKPRPNADAKKNKKEKS